MDGKPRKGSEKGETFWSHPELSDSFGWFWMVGWFYIVLDGFRWFWMVLDGFGWF